jgi:formate hydrogenlyase subunit 3/multisubunit Na+/H+ antiporter MnhD subunit
MSAPVLWIIAPAGVGVLIFFLRRLKNVGLYIGMAFCFWLAWMAWAIPFEEPMSIGSYSLVISESFTVLGRQFTLTNAQRPFISFLYLMNSLWLLGVFFARPSTLFPPFAMITLALLVAALAVEPFLFAALMIETIVLLAIPLLAEPGQHSRRGTLRFLAFQTFGMPFILFTGGMLAGVEASPSDIALVIRAGILMAIGFAFLLAIFPFHSWIPMVAEESHPYVAAFLFFMLPGVVSLFGLGFLDRFVWLRESEALLSFVLAVGMLMVAAGGLWAAFETNLGRMMGHAAVMEIGLSLLAIGLGGPVGMMVYFWLFLPRAVSFVVWAISLSRLQRGSHHNLDFEAVRGFGTRNPRSSIALLVAQFSLAGLPFLAGFQVRLVLWENLAASYPVIAVVAVLGAIGLLAGGLRTVMVLFVSKEDEEHALPQEPLVEPPADLIENLPAQAPEIRARRILSWVVFGSFMAAFLLIGLFPQRYLPFIKLFSQIFEQLGT